MQEDVNENPKKVTISLKGVSSSKGSKHHEAIEQKHAEEALQNSHEQLTDVLGSISDGFFIVDKNFKITYVNKSAEELLGRKAEEVLGHHLFDEAFPEAKDSIFEQKYKQALRTQKPVSFESYFPVEPYENWYAVRVYPYQDGLSIYFQVITKRKQIEKALRESQRQLSIRNKIVEIFLTIPDDEMYGAVLNVLLEAMESKYGIFGYIDEHERLIVPSMTRDIWKKCQVPDKTIIYPREKWGGIWGRALKEKKSLYANEGLHVPEGHVPITRVLAVPVMYGSQVIGLLNVANKPTDYSHKDQEFLESIAGKIAPILNARLQRDREERERKRSEEAMKSALEESRKRSAETSALLESSRAILRSQKFQETAESIFRTCKNLIGATAGYVALLSSDGAENEVLFLDAGGRPCTVDPNLPMPIRGLREQTYLTGKAVYENDFSNSEWVKFMPKGHASLDNVLFAPFTIDRKVVGLLGLANKPGGFCENDVRMATAFGELASVALQNSRMLESLENSEERFRSVMESANNAVVSVDHNGNVILWNKAAEEIFGYTPEEILGKPVTLIMPERFHQAHHYGMQRFLSTGISKTVGNAVEVAALKKDGSEFPIEVSLSNWKAGGEMFFTAIIRDITERKRAEEQINNLARFPSENPFPILRISQDGKVLYSNPPGMVLLEQWNCKIGQKAPKDWCKLVSKALESKRYQVKELNCDKKIFSFAIAPVADEGYVNLYGRNITKRKRAEDALQKSWNELDLKVKQRTAELTRTVTTLQEEVLERIAAEKKLKESTRDLDAFFSNTITPLVILDKDFNFIRVNKAYADADERDISDFDGHNHFEFYPHEENQRIFEGVVKTKTPYQVLAKPFIFPDHPEWGVTYWDWTLVPILGDGGEVELLIFSLNDVTEREHAEQAVKESEEKYRSFVESSPEAVCVVTDEKIDFVNTAALKLMNAVHAEEMTGKSMWDFIHPDSIELVGRDIKEMLDKNSKVPPREVKIIRLDNSIVEVEVSATSIVHKGKPSLLVIFHDITERKSAELRKDVTNSLLELFVQKDTRKEYLDSVVEVISNWSGCRCVGIRLVNSDGCIPYESHVGFGEEFMSVENMLSLNTDFCVCIRVVTKDGESSDTKVMTERGSFRCGDTFGFVKSLAEHEQKLYRGHCVKCGFASVAVVPVPYRQNILGAVHLADEGRNKVPLETIEFLEDMAALIGEAVHRFNVEESLRLNEERLLEAQRLAHLGNWEWDIIKNRLWWSDEVYRIFGVEPGQFGATNEAFLSYVHPQDREFVKKSVNGALYEGKSYNIYHRVIKPDGKERIVQEKAEVVYDSNHKPIKMIGTVHDVTEQKKTEDEIRESQRKLRALTAELQLVEEQERRRIAQDLHDSVGQILAFSCGGLKTLQKSLPDKAAKSVQKITNQLDTAVEQARTLSFDLSPSTLYDLGFEVAVEDLVDRMAEERKLRCQFENCSLPKPLADDVKILLYRSVRELLINAVKHAGASLLRVKLVRSSSDIHITVEDDGEGFDVSVLDKDSTKRKGFGIFSIRERLGHIGGVLKIESAEGKGTKVVLIAPLDIEKEDEQELTNEYKNNTG